MATLRPGPICSSGRERWRVWGQGERTVPSACQPTAGGGWFPSYHSALGVLSIHSAGLPGMGTTPATCPCGF